MTLRLVNHGGKTGIFEQLSKEADKIQLSVCGWRGTGRRSRECLKSGRWTQK